MLTMKWFMLTLIELGIYTVELQFVVLTPEGVINVSASDNFIETLTDVFEESGLPIEVSLRTAN